MKKSWKSYDIVDLEYFLHSDQGTAPAALQQRDRAIFLAAQDEGETAGCQEPRDLLRHWLRCRRRSFSTEGKEPQTPGIVLAFSCHQARTLLCLLGVLFGFLAGLSFFTYAGATPINVFSFLLLFVAPQLLLSLFFVCSAGGRLLRPSLPTGPLYQFLLTGPLAILGRLIDRRRWFARSPHSRDSWLFGLHFLQKQQKVYGAVFYWQLALLAQLLALGGNLGLLLAGLQRVLTRDLAFGWQSTLQLSAELIHRLVSLLALPWSWLFGEGVGYPSLAEIEGSRIILKDGISHLLTANLTAWWPFLLLCVLCYGLLLRGSFLLYSVATARRAINTLAFDTPACRSLLQRMQTPIVTSSAPPEIQTTQAAALNPLSDLPAIVPDGLQLLLIPGDLRRQLDMLLTSFPLEITEIIYFMEDYEDDEQLLSKLTARQWPEDQGVTIVMEAWMPPLVSFISWLARLREGLPANTQITIALAGRLRQSGLGPVSSQDHRVWQHKLAELIDPYLHLLPLPSIGEKTHDS